MSNIELKRYKYLQLFTGLSVVALYIAYTFAYRPIELGWFTFPGGTITFPLTYLVGDIITEVYGYRQARQIIWITIGCLVFYCFMSYITVRLPSPTIFHQTKAFSIVFQFEFRKVIAFILGLLVSDFLNSILLSRLKVIRKGEPFWVRSMFSTMIGELVFSLITDTIVFVGVVSFPEVLHIIFSAYVFKMAYTAIAIVPLAIIVQIIKEKEDADTYDYGVNYNPFRFLVEK